MHQRRNVMTAAVWTLLFAIGLVFVAACDSGVPKLETATPRAVLSPAIIGAASVYLDIVNNGNGPDTLKSARVDVPGTVAELHDTQDGRMVKREGIPIPAHSSVRLRPGGPHIMVYLLPKNIKAGSSVTLTLFFRKSGAMKVETTMVNNN